MTWASDAAARARIALSLAVLCAVGTLSACGASDATRPSAASLTSITLQSDPGDYIGAGKSYSFTQATAGVTISLGGKFLIVTVEGDDRWFGNFHLPALEKGTYSVTRAGLDWNVAGRGCTTVTGTITIDDIQLLNGDLSKLDMRFEQYCNGAAAALRGTIHYNAFDTTVPPGPTAIPAGLWQPPAEPATAGNFVYLYSDAGDFIGQGTSWKYAAPATSISLTSSYNLVYVSVAGWEGAFQGMRSISKLEVGYYSNLIRYAFHNPARGGLSWTGQGRACKTLTGWFAVDKVTYSGTTLTALDLRFEQHCEGGVPALHGVLHFVE